MANIYNYVKEFGNILFSELDFNDVDNIVFSLLSYLNFDETNINQNKTPIPLYEVADKYLKMNTYKEVSKLGIPQRDAYKLLKLVIDKKRYKDVLLSDYRYVVGEDKQFCALTFDYMKNKRYICFEGTDELISGWKEDGKIACQFPVPSHLEGIKYVNENTTLFGPSVIIGGHSKGGNLALVASMYMKWYKKCKVTKVYNNDGPGLRLKEFTSKEYRNLKSKYIHIVPEYSYIGVLLRNDTYNVIKSNKKNVLSHSISTWEIEGNKFVSGLLSDKSKQLEKGIISWLDKHNDNERIQVLKSIFKIFEDAHIEDTVSMLKLGNILKIVHNIKDIDKDTKEMIIDLFTYNYNMLKGNGDTK